MTEEAIFRWQGEMFILASYLYYVEDYSIMSDDRFDDLGNRLLKTYWPKLPPDIQQRITQDRLRAGTGYDLEFTEEDIRKAHEWRDRVEALPPSWRSII